MRAALLLCAVALLLAGACTQQDRHVPSAAAKLVVIPVGMARPRTALPLVVAEVVATPERRSRGLGGRDRVDDGDGMLFVYPRDEPRRYWMKDCFVALDIAFIDREGRIVNLATLPAGANLADDKIAAAESAAPARYVLETAAGWMARHGIAAGDAVDLAAALEGVDPQ